MAERLRWCFAAAPLLLLLVPGPAAAFEIGNLAGKNRDKAHKRLKENGYKQVDEDVSGERAYELWWKAEKKKCVRLEVKLKGKVHRVKEAKKVNKKNCQ